MNILILALVLQVRGTTDIQAFLIKNLSKLLGKHVPPSRVDALIKEADTTGEGTISFEEFLNMFRTDNSKQVAKVLEH